MDALSLVIPVAAGKLAPSDQQKQAIGTFLQTCEKKGRVSVKFNRQTEPRSNRQNKYYWSAVLPCIAASLGYEVNDLHEAIKEKFLPPVFMKLGNTEVQVRKTTTSLTTREFELFLESLRIWAGSELGITIPLPGE